MKMDTSFKLQAEIRNNAEDLRKYMLDLENWVDEMHQKEGELKKEKPSVTDYPPPRNKRNNSENNEKENNLRKKEKKTKKIAAYDYAAWDKYDADKACDELDEESVDEKVSSPVVEEVEEKEEVEEPKKKTSPKNIDEAFYEKELGNAFVKKEKWEDAIKCYSRAIELDSNNAIYYSNRSICFIKLKNFRAAEVDATIAIQLDNTYVKAFQRRALARTALGQIEEALADYKEIIKLDPKNALANAEITKLEQKLKGSNTVQAKTNKPLFNPKSIFTSKARDAEPSKKATENRAKKELPAGGDVAKSRLESPKISEVKEIAKKVGGSGDEGSGTRVVVQPKKPEEKVAKVPEENAKNVFGEVPEGFRVVKPIRVPPHLRSKNPLKRIPIKDVASDTETVDELAKMMSDRVGSEEDGTKTVEDSCRRVVAGIEALPVDDEREHPVPETCVQFQQAWKFVKRNPARARSYLKKIKAENLKRIFKHSLESDLFSELLSAMAEEEMLQDVELVYSFLYHLPDVPRFGSLIMFMSTTDRENLNKCISRMSSAKTETELDCIRDAYELRK